MKEGSCRKMKEVRGGRKVTEGEGRKTKEGEGRKEGR